ncbi:MAG TPA: hypothetical protein O0Y04_01920 [Methanocorpusculum sp.]|nr:hypothetical protein [Methanocorpusculum sp.]
MSVDLFVRDLYESEVTGVGEFYGKRCRRQISRENGEPCVERFSYGVCGRFSGDDEGSICWFVSCPSQGMFRYSDKARLIAAI